MDRKNDSCIKTIGYQRPDLKEHRVDEEILRRLEVNDPGVEYLSYTDDCYYDDLRLDRRNWECYRSQQCFENAKILVL